MIAATEVNLQKDVLNTSEANFTKTALNVFRFQYHNNKIYRQYCDLLHTVPEKITSIEEIPFLPIQFFKRKKIMTTSFNEEILFESSGTTGSVNGRHYVKDKGLYEESFLKSFRQFYGDEKKYCIIGLLPSYLERQNSSLVYMVQELIRRSENEYSGFYLQEFDKLKDLLLQNERGGQRTFLIGVTYALIDFAEKNNLKLHHTTIMETGGMKGRREELTRTQVHKILKNKLGILKVHSEYGMTELLSQAYSSGEGIFVCPPWMKVLVRSEDDPFEISSARKSGGKYASGAINIIDLANIYSCAFIATDDAGKIYADESFEITGRIENSDMRGCSLMDSESARIVNDTIG